MGYRPGLKRVQLQQFDHAVSQPSACYLKEDGMRYVFDIGKGRATVVQSIHIIYKYTYTHVHVYIDIYTHMYAYIYIYTYIYILIPRSTDRSISQTFVQPPPLGPQPSC